MVQWKYNKQMKLLIVHHPPVIEAWLIYLFLFSRMQFFTFTIIYFHISMFNRILKDNDTLLIVRKYLFIFIIKLSNSNYK